ncbi:MAG TPA: DUF2167 domain-containing protein, partial [Saprospiraceae bacterium]|nr:DUF2167 domain-containing protein [Saprospiraceae bacterium]
MRHLIKILSAIVLLPFTFHATCQDSNQLEFLLDSIEKSFVYVDEGAVDLPNNVSSLKIPDGYKYLNKDQSRFVLEDLWGNPEDTEIDGMLFPDQFSPLDSQCWAYVITYSKMGYIKDNDADKIDYDDLL